MIQQGAAAVQVTADPWAVAAFLAYLLVIIGIGLYARKFSSAGVSEFFVGGRKMNRFVVALSAVVSGRSAWLLLGVTGMAYASGASAVWAVTGYFRTFSRRGAVIVTAACEPSSSPSFSSSWWGIYPPNLWEAVRHSLRALG